MRATTKALIGGFIALAIAGCATPQSVKPGMAKSEVAAAFPRPDARIPTAEGGEIWQYPTGPMGWTNHMVRFGPDGRVQDVTQALTPENFLNIRPGMTPEDVRRLVGRPAETVRFPNLKQEVWSYRYLDRTQIIPFYMLDVHFDFGGAVTHYTMYVDPTYDPRAGGGGDFQ